MLIALAGLPCSGKSSTARALGALLAAPFYLEPEEDKWPELIRRREITGRFTALTWFRSARLPGLFAAKEISDLGGTAIVDSYYDKLISLYLEEESFSWLIPKSDPYFTAAAQMAKTDYHFLPNADVLVLLRVQKDTWLRLMTTRGRKFDQSTELAHYFDMQSHFERACQTAACEHEMRLIVIEQEWSSAEETARRLHKELKDVL